MTDKKVDASPWRRSTCKHTVTHEYPRKYVCHDCGLVTPR